MACGAGMGGTGLELGAVVRATGALGCNEAGTGMLSMADWLTYCTSSTDALFKRMVLLLSTLTVKSRKTIWASLRMFSIPLQISGSVASMMPTGRALKTAIDLPLRVVC